MARSRRDPTFVFANFSAGGVPAGITEGVFASHIERETGLPISKLVDGCHASSAGTSIAVPLFIGKAEDRSSARYTADEALALFKDNAEVWLDRPIPYLRQHFRQVARGLNIPFMRSAQKEAFMLDERLVEQTLDQYLGDITLRDLMKTFTVSAHNISAAPRDEAVQLGKLVDRLGRTRYNPTPDTKIADLMRGSMAVPGHYKTKFVQGVGNLQDFGHLYDAHNAFGEFLNTIPQNARTLFIEFGAPRHHNHFTADQLNGFSLLQLVINSHLARGTSSHSYSLGMQAVKHLMRGNGEVFDMTPLIDVHGMKNRIRPSENILDASKKSMRCAEEHAHDYIENNEKSMDRLCDLLVENHASRNTANPTAAFNLKPAQEKRGILASLFSRKPAMAPPVAVPALN